MKLRILYFSQERSLVVKVSAAYSGCLEPKPRPRDRLFEILRCFLNPTNEMTQYYFVLSTYLYLPRCIQFIFHLIVQRCVISPIKSTLDDLKIETTKEKS